MAFSMPVSIRHGGHWPQHSRAKKSAMRATSSTRHSPSATRCTTPQPSAEPASFRRLVVERDVELVGLAGTRSKGPPGRIALIFFPPFSPPPFCDQAR
jgi:hypothetical protein